MSEGSTHKQLKKTAMLWLKKQVIDVVCPEVDFNNIKCIADAVGINFKRKEVRVIEVKSTKKDLIRDNKLFDEKTSYYYHCHYCYIMCPENIIDSEDIPDGYGLLWVNEQEQVVVVKRPKKNKSRLKTMYETTLRIATKRLTNIVLYSDDKIKNKDETSGFFDKRANIKMISVKCIVCKNIIKDLVNKKETKYVICDCGNKIDLNNIKIREITGFNNKFIEKIKKLT